MSEPSRELIDELFRGKVRAARRMTPEDKLAVGGELFDDVCDRMRSGIRAQYPNLDDDEVEEKLRQRLDIARRLEDSR